MSALTNIWRQLLQRRLWPVAILLVAGLAAVPLLLAKDPDPVPPAPQPASVTDPADAALAAEPIVAQATAAGNTVKGRKVVGKSKNPFGMPRKTTSGSDAAPTTGTVVSRSSTEDADDDTSSGSTGGGTSSGGGTTTPTPSSPAPTTPAEPAPKPRTYAPQELTIRFGGDELQRQSLKRLEALPSEDEPMLIYMGLLNDGKTAEFMVGDGVAPVGDGECRPSPEECQTVRLRAGETEFFDVQDESGNVGLQFQLDLLKIHRSGGASASRAKASVKAAVRLAESGTALRSTAGQSIARLP